MILNNGSMSRCCVKYSWLRWEMKDLLCTYEGALCVKAKFFFRTIETKAVVYRLAHMNFHLAQAFYMEKSRIFSKRNDAFVYEQMNICFG